MLEYACIFTTGGVLLFQQTFHPLKFNPIDILIKRVLVQDRGSEQKLYLEPYTVKWTVANDLKIIFAVVYQEQFQLQFVEDLLELTKKHYKEKIFPQLTIENGFYINIPDYEQSFDLVLRKWEEKQQKNQQKEKIMRSFNETKRGKEVEKSDANKSKKNKKKKNNEGEEEVDDNEQDIPMNTPSKDTPEPTPEESKTPESKKNLTAAERAKIAREKVQGKPKTPKAKEPEQTETPPQRHQKEKTTWNMPSGKNNKKTEGLDFGEKFDQEKVISKAKEQYLGETPDGLEGKFLNDNDMLDLSSDDEDEIDTSKPKKGGLFSRFTSAVQNVTGNKVLTAQDLEPVMKNFKEALMEKNVAEGVALNICQSIEKKLIDTKTKSFTSIKKTVQEAFIESLTKILTPKRNIDPISEAMRAKEQGRPFVMCFIGVNGVGKSTNLAKVAHLLKKKGGFSVLLAACDNFRAGAVEQIKTHGRCLEVPVFDQGYKSDPALIASAAIKEATLRKIDCVLIDTAGRMQDNEPLMKALARLVALNQPDLIMFVGEALVGNDAVDQLTKFNQSLIDLSPPDKIREIDAILLTKFDTVDDKVGAAVSMTYSTGKPVLFVGTGQKYTHLRKLNVNTVVNTLLS